MASLGELFVKVGADISGFQAAMGDLGAELKSASRKVNAEVAGWNQLGNNLKSAGTSLTAGLTLPIVAAGAAFTAFAADLNAGMANVATLIPGNTARINELKTAIQNLSIDTTKSTGDLVGGLYQVISAFGDTSDTVDILRINAQAATAGLSTVTEAINLTSAVTKAYGDTSAAAVQHVADLALQAVVLGQTTFPELAASIGRVAPVAQQMGVSIQELFGFMATFTGVTGSAAEVSTQLRTVLNGLLKPTADMEKALAALGFESGKAAIEQLGLRGTLELLSQSTGGNVTQMGKLFGSVEALNIVFPATGAQADTLKEKIGAMGQASGATQRAFDEQAKGVNALGFEFAQAKRELIVMAQRMGDALAPALLSAMNAARPLLEGLRAMVNWFTSLPTPIQTAAIAFAALAAAIGPILLVAGSLITSITSLIALKAVLLPLIAGTTSAFAALSAAVVPLLTAALTPLLVVIGAIAAVFAAWKLAEWAYANWEPFRVLVDATWELLKNLAGFLVEVLIASFSLVWDVIKVGVHLWLSLVKAIADWGPIRITLEAIKLLFATTFNAIAGAIGWVAEKLGILRSALAGFNADVDKATPKSAALGTAYKTMGDEAKKATDLTVGLATSITRPRKGLNDALSESVTGLKNQKKALDDGKSSLTKQTQATKEAADKSDQYSTALFKLSQKVRAVISDEDAWRLSLNLLESSVQDLNSDIKKLVEAPIAESMRAAMNATAAAAGKVAVLKDAYETLGVKSRAELESIVEKTKAARDAILGDTNATAFAKSTAIYKALEAQRALAIQLGTDLPAEQLRTMQKIKADLDDSSKGLPSVESKWRDSFKSISTIITNFAQDTAKSLWDGSQSWGEKFKGLLKSLAEAVTSMFLEPFTKAITSFIADTLEGLLGPALNKIGGWLGGAIGSIGGGGGAGIPSIPTAPPVGTTPPLGGAGGAAGALIGGAMGWIGVGAAVAGAVSSIIGNFQMMGMNKSLDIIVKHTLQTVMIGEAMFNWTMFFLDHIANNTLAALDKLDWINTNIFEGLNGIHERLIELRTLGMGIFHAPGHEPITVRLDATSTEAMIGSFAAQVSGAAWREGGAPGGSEWRGGLNESVFGLTINMPGATFQGVNEQMADDLFNMLAHRLETHGAKP